MLAFTARRLLFAVPTLLVISFVLFALLALAPGDPTGDLPLTIPDDVREQIRLSLGLDELVDAPTSFSNSSSNRSTSCNT